MMPRALLAAAALLTTTTLAAEAQLGTIVVTDAGTSHNLLPLDGGSFYIAPRSLLTVQPNAAAWVCVDQRTTLKAPTCSATLGVKVAADVAFPSSCKPEQQVLMADGGLVASCTVTLMPVSGTSVTATVFSRDGHEF